MLTLRVNVVVFLVVTTINIAVFLLALCGFFGWRTDQLLEIMCRSSLGFVVASLSCCFVDSGDIENEVEVLHPAGFYVLMALGYAVFVAAHAWAMFAR